MFLSKKSIIAVLVSVPIMFLVALYVLRDGRIGSYNDTGVELKRGVDDLDVWVLSNEKELKRLFKERLNGRLIDALGDINYELSSIILDDIFIGDSDGDTWVPISFFGNKAGTLAVHMRHNIFEDRYELLEAVELMDRELAKNTADDAFRKIKAMPLPPYYEVIGGLDLDLVLPPIRPGYTAIHALPNKDQLANGKDYLVPYPYYKESPDTRIFKYETEEGRRWYIPIRSSGGAPTIREQILYHDHQ